MRNHCFQKFGFTLIEVLTAVIILSIGVLGIYRGILTVLRYQNYAAYHLAAQGIFENYAAEKLGDPKGSRIDGKFYEQISVGRIINNHPVDFTVFAQGTADDAIKGLTQIDVAIVWNSHGRKNQLLRFFVVFQEPLQEES